MEQQRQKTLNTKAAQDINISYEEFYHIYKKYNRIRNKQSKDQCLNHETSPRYQNKVGGIFTL